jgi:RNA polymerase sigma factor (sigma-70 family)
LEGCNGQAKSTRNYESYPVCDILTNDQSIMTLTLQQEVTLSNTIPILLAIVRRILRNYPTVAVDCEDVVQEVLLETTQKLTAGEGIENLIAYLQRSAANRAINLAKKLNRSRGILFELDDGSTGYMITDAPDERVDLLLEKERQFMEYRATLVERETLVLDMLMEGFAPQNIAEILGVKVNNIYVITHRLRRKFNHLLSEKNAAQV